MLELILMSNTLQDIYEDLEQDESVFAHNVTLKIFELALERATSKQKSKLVQAINEENLSEVEKILQEIDSLDNLEVK